MSRQRISSKVAILALTLYAAMAGAIASDYLVGPMIWKDVDGTPLPFQSTPDIEDFLRTAEVESTESISEGILAQKKRLVLQRNGIRVYACFRYGHIFKSQERLQSGKIVFNFRDEAFFEIAAYELAKLLGLPNIPPTVLRKIEDKEGSLQIWVPDALMEKDRLEQGLTPKNAWRWLMQTNLMDLFDNLIYNEDRNRGNVIYDADWNLWMIDHTRAFRNYDELLDTELVASCERGVWERLQTLPDEAFQEVLEPYLKESEIKRLLQRREKLVRQLQGHIEEKGESQVLFTLWADPS